MASTRAVTVRLSDQQIKVIDALAKWTAREVNGIPVNRPTRSDIIRVCIAGYLTDHPGIVAEALREEEGG
jgi:hypothetical protein